MLWKRDGLATHCGGFYAVTLLLVYLPKGVNVEQQPVYYIDHAVSSISVLSWTAINYQRRS